MAKLAKRPSSIFLVLDDENYVGYFKTFKAAFDHIERGEFGGSVILEVVAATEVIPPEEPDYECNEVNLSTLVG